MKGIVNIHRKATSEIWNITSGNFSIFSRNRKKLLNFWVEASVPNKSSKENRSEFGISVEVLFEIENHLDMTNFNLRIPYVNVPTLGELEKYKEYQLIWGEDKDLYYNIYYDEHTDIENATIKVKKEKNEYVIILEGIFDDRFHQGSEETEVNIIARCQLDNEHKGFWTQ